MSRTSGPAPSDPARCQVRRRCGARAARAGGVGVLRPLRARPEHVARSPLTFPQGHPRGPAAAGGGGEGRAPAAAARLTSTGARVPAAEPVGAAGSAARDAGISGARRAYSPPAAAWDLQARGRRVSRRRAGGGQRVRNPGRPLPTLPAPAAHLCAAARPACWVPW